MNISPDSALIAESNKFLITTKTQVVACSGAIHDPN